MATRKLDGRARANLGILVVAAAALAFAYARAPERPRDAALAGGVAIVVCALVAAAVIAERVLARRAWVTGRALAAALVGLAGIYGVFIAHTLSRSGPFRPTMFDLIFVPVGVLFLVPARMEFRDHFRNVDRREIVMDVALVAASGATVSYLFLLPHDSDTASTVSSAVFALVALSTFTAYAALALWVPSAAHIGQFLIMGTLATTVMVFASGWVEGSYRGGDPAVDLPFGFGALALAGLVALLPRHASHRPQASPARWGQPLLTALAAGGACATLAVISISAIDGDIGGLQASILIGGLAAGVASRILMNQVKSIKATDDVSHALDQKEEALQETDLAMKRLRRANETLRSSEERLRLLFEAAVDGIVEMDESDVILRANEAFCNMVATPERLVAGRPWTALAAVVNGADQSFASLPSTGQATLQREGHSLHLEARMSEIPGNPPRRLLMVRDVTAARVADQTIRSLFKFLQDRDEDRTRLLRRTNAAIEAERNRIARDLHDGPVQGVSAASLSLEAVLLMLKAGDSNEGTSVLSKVREELSEEADNLRRLMSGLRPPLLEERGLVPAIRDTLARFGEENGVETSFNNQSLVEVPADLETLAYRVVQEALSNAAKHAQPTHVSVTVELAAGQIRIEVADDGVGFDPAKAREYLRMGRVGLASMRERVELANGTFMVNASPGKGTTVLATLPLDASAASTEFASG